MATSRNASQEKAMIIVYDALTYQAIDLEFDIRELISDIIEQPYEEADMYIREVVVKAVLHQDRIISLIEPNLNKWAFKRLNRLAQAILLLAVAHHQEVKDVPKPVVIDIAVRLAKKFLDDGDYKFINGVLDKSL